MKILMLLSTSSVTGPAEVALSDAHTLAARGHEVLFGFDTRRPGNFGGAIRAAGFRPMDELTLCPKPRPHEVVLDALRLRARLGTAGLVHCRFAHDHALALLASAGMRRRPALVRTVETARALAPGRGRGFTLRRADALVVSCQAYARLLAENHGVAPERIHLLPGRVDAARFSPGPGEATRESLGVGLEDILFGIVSRIKADRHHELLVRGFARMAHDHPEAKLAIVGRGEHEPVVRELVGALGLGSRVLFAGYRAGDALVEAYRALDAKVWLAEGNDGTCRAVLEAMACGKPVVCGRPGPMADLVRDGEDGFLVDLDEAAIARALAALCDPELRALSGANARRRAEEFDAARRARGLAAAYASALARRGRGQAGADLGL